MDFRKIQPKNGDDAIVQNWGQVCHNASLQGEIENSCCLVDFYFPNMCSCFAGFSNCFQKRNFQKNSCIMHERMNPQFSYEDGFLGLLDFLGCWLDKGITNFMKTNLLSGIIVQDPWFSSVGGLKRILSPPRNLLRCDTEMLVTLGWNLWRQCCGNFWFGHFDFKGPVLPLSASSFNSWLLKQSYFVLLEVKRVFMSMKRKRIVSSWN